MEGVEGGKFDAVVGSEADEVDFGEALSFEEIGEAGGFLVAVVEETAVAIDL